MSRERLLVLESYWDEDFGEKKSVRPFIEGWSTQARIGVAYRAYGNRHDLRHWLERFRTDETLDIVYIAGHGLGTRLVGLGDRGINIAALLIDVFRKGRGPGSLNLKGVLVGACECGGIRTRIVEGTNQQLSWVAGYGAGVTLPWFESTLCDLMFLSYRRGRVCRRNNPTGDLDQREGGDVSTVAKWVLEDFPLAKAWGFGVAMRPIIPRKEKSRWRRKR